MKKIGKNALSKKFQFLFLFLIIGDASQIVFYHVSTSHFFIILIFFSEKWLNDETPRRKILEEIHAFFAVVFLTPHRKMCLFCVNIKSILDIHNCSSKMRTLC
jgi:hypothetical protein